MFTRRSRPLPRRKRCRWRGASAKRPKIISRTSGPCSKGRDNVLARGTAGVFITSPLVIRQCEDSVLTSSPASVARNEPAKSAVSTAGRETYRLAVPRRGHVLSTIVEVYGKPIRQAVGALAASLAKKNCSPG